MNKRKLHHFLVRLRKLSYIYVLVAFVVSLGISGFALRRNNLEVIRLRDEVLKVDEKNGDVERALKNLQHYVYGHMNTNLSTGTGIYPPIQLKYRYERLVAAEKARVSQINDKIYNEAQVDCERRMPGGSLSSRVPCVQAYIDSHGGVKEQPIPDALYKFDFASPQWSPDLAGWSLVASFLLAFLLVVRLLLELWLRSRLKHHL